MRKTLAQRVQVTVEGTVQGVGFRPFVYRLARELGLAGWVQNTRNGVLIEAEGGVPVVEMFLQRLRTDAPPSASIETVITTIVPVLDEAGFSINQSAESGQRVLVIPPDLATCDDCQRELADPHDRRFRYPFLTCTQCGPRYSLLTAIPYERSNTTMAGFTLCSACDAEYGAETDRRFHAEPIACPTCGPRLCLWNGQGHEVADGEEALQRAVSLLEQGLVLAVKGLGGFQLWVDARSQEAVQRLRNRKRRPDKPFALLFPSIDAVRSHCLLSSEEEALLRSPQAPIVLARKRRDASLADAVAPANPYLGVMLPTTPLYHLLMASLQRPMVATSGNRSEEPIVTDEWEAPARLNGIADAFLVHDRPIARPVDDSVVLVVPGKVQSVDGEQEEKPRADVMILRRARGYVPQAIRWCDNATDGTTQGPILAVGGHLKNTVALLTGNRVVLSQHLGDLSTVEADRAFRQAVVDLQQLLHVTPLAIACDLHPDYRSTSFARELAVRLSVPLVPVQHHHAHVASCMAEHKLDGDVLGIAWDGAGYGGDGQVWGGEFLIADYGRFTRFASLTPFRLLGGEAAMREPSRSAAAILWELMGEQMLTQDLPSWRVTDDQREKFAGVLKSGIALPWSTSMGRLFDAVASFTGLCHQASFEGQAAMAVQFPAEQEWEACGRAEGYPMDLAPSDSSDTTWLIGWRPMISAILGDLRRGIGPDKIAARFHIGLAVATVRVAQAAGLPCVVLTGGCFQNRLLLRLVKRYLEEAGFTVYCHTLVPPNDGGLSLGQAVVAANQLMTRKEGGA